VPLSSEDIERPRSPRELAEFVEQFTAAVRADSCKLRAGNSRSGYYKQFLDEIVPLARFALHAYDDSYTIQPILGNQGFDAIVRDCNSRIVDRVEIANPIDGATVAATAREVAERGYGGIRVTDPGNYIDDLIPIIERVARNKATKDYSDTTVVFNVSALPPIAGFEDRHEEQIDTIRKVLIRVGFNAKRVYLLHPPYRLDRIDP
jgi:hypothetical protein